MSDESDSIFFGLIGGVVEFFFWMNWPFRLLFIVILVLLFAAGIEWLL